MRNDPAVVDQMLRDTGTAAVIGLSDRIHRPAWEVSLYLQDVGITLIPVHPRAIEVHGERVVRTVFDIPATEAVDTAILFVRPEIGDEVVDQIIERGGIPNIWMQPGATNDDAADRAEAAGIRVVRDLCIKVEYATRG